MGSRLVLCQEMFEHSNPQLGVLSLLHGLKQHTWYIGTSKEYTMSALEMPTLYLFDIKKLLHLENTKS